MKLLITRDDVVSQRLKFRSAFLSYFSRESKIALLVQLALAERDSKNAGVSLFSSVGPSLYMGHAFIAETVKTGDKNRDDIYCMQMSLVMSMTFIFGDD